MDRPGFEGAAYMCSPSPRTTEEHGRVWEMIRRGTLDVVSSDHCGFSMGGEHGKASPAGMPASTPSRTASRASRRGCRSCSARAFEGADHARRFRPAERDQPGPADGAGAAKGMIAIGADADLALWDPKKKVTLTNTLMQHAIDYTPYEGLEVTGWPVATVRRGTVVMRDGVVQAEPGRASSCRAAPMPHGDAARRAGQRLRRGATAECLSRQLPCA